MVMHGRKFPRLDDGYYDRNQSHLMEEEPVNNSRKYDRYASKKRDIPGIDNFCGHSPSLQPSPRYASKPGHGERKTEKERGSVDRRAEDSRQNSHGYKDVRNKDKDQKLKDHKAEVHKLAEKVCGDWSEHVSSSGKRYYYNCKTEVSQWERPEEWVEASGMPLSSRTPRTKDASQKMTSTGHKGQRDWSKHSVSDKNPTKTTTPVLNSQSNSRILTNDLTKSDGLLNDESHRTDGALLTNTCNRSHRTSVTPSSKTSSEGSATVGNDNVAHGNCCSVDTSFGDRTPRREGCAGTTSSPTWASGTPISLGGIYGLVASSGGLPNSNDYRQRGRINDSLHLDVAKCDDMDISPGSTPTEESMLEKHASGKASSNQAVAGTPVSTPLSLEQPGSVTPLSGLTPTMLSSSSLQEKASTSSSTSVSNQTVLSTLAALQQAVTQLTVDKTSGLATGNVQRPQTSALFSCLPLLTPLISQLSSDKLVNSQSRPQDRQQNQQITRQAIEMLQKLQQVLVAQQQQQQQRQLQQLLLQLLSVQKNSGRPATSLSSQWTTPPPTKQMKLDSSTTNDDKSESPYSPPDSDGTPLGSPDVRSHHQSLATQLPNENASTVHLEVAKPDEMDAESNRHQSPLPVNVASAVQPVTLGTSQLAAATVHRKQDSTGLTPSLANYYNSQLTEHVSGWQVDIIERQADCFAEEAHTVGSIHCTQVSVDLKRARSLVRANEIQATLQEQRIMFSRQRHRELEQGQVLFMPLQDS